MIKVQILATLTQGCFSSTSISDKKEYMRIQPPAVWQTKHLYLGVGCFKQSVTCSEGVPTAWRMDATPATVEPSERCTQQYLFD